MEKRTSLSFSVAVFIGVSPPDTVTVPNLQRKALSAGGPHELLASTRYIPSRMSTVLLTLRFDHEPTQSADNLI